MRYFILAIAGISFVSMSAYAEEGIVDKVKDASVKGYHETKDAGIKAYDKTKEVSGKEYDKAKKAIVGDDKSSDKN